MGKQTLNYCCIKCGGYVSISSALYGTGTCWDCRDISGKNNPNYGKKHVFSDIAKLNMRNAHLGEKAHQYIDGRSTKEYHCIDCDAIVSRWSGFYGEGRCASCARKHDWTKPEYRAKKIQDMNSFKKGPNKPETFLINFLDSMLPYQYNYVGDLVFFVDKFNPDFVNVQRTKIIEFFGEYWHNRPEIIIRDELRFKTYKANGYDTLVLFQADLADATLLEKKIKEFNDK